LTGAGQGLTSSFGAWQFYQDTSSTNVTEKQNFVDNLYNLTFVNRPTITALSARNILDNEIPNVVNININNANPRIAENLNITARITDNIGIDQVLLYTNLSGVFKYIPMTLISGDATDGYWSFTGYIPGNASGKVVVYQIWCNDTSGQISSSNLYQFTVKKATFWDWLNWLLLLLNGEGINIIIIIVIGSVAGTGILTTTYVIKRQTKSEKTKKKAKSKRKKGTSLGAEEIRKIMRKSIEPEVRIPTISLESLKSTIKGPIGVIPGDIRIRVQNLKNLTDEEKDLLLRDLALLDDKKREDWLREIEELE
ncbi:MAG: hypothetical protein ACTSRG_15985, partial [Candidatus Helarchaeota archaeon]